MLSSPAAQRRAALSVTLGDLPAQDPYLITEVTSDHHLITVRDGLTYGELAYSYQRWLDGWARARLFAAIGQPDPVTNPAGYARARWWHPDWLLTPTSIHLLEDAAPGLVVPWPHEWILTPV